LIITAQRFREQDKNPRRCPCPAGGNPASGRYAQPVRRPTKVPKTSKRKRLEGKKHRAEIKRGRSKPE
jgi:ribosome-associated protein